MSPNAHKLLATLITAGIIGMALAYSPVSRAFNFGDMMNPGRWMGGNRDRNDDYYGRPYAGPRGGSYGGGPRGGPWGGYGPVPYGGSPYGMPRYPGAVPPVPTASTAKTSSAPVTNSSELDTLKQRIRELESQQQPPASLPDDQSAPPPLSDGGSELIFRPMGNE